MKNNIINFFKSKTNYKLFDKGGVCIYVYPFQYLQIRKNINFYKKADYILLDGMLLTSIFNLFKISNNKRMSIDFSSIAKDLFDYISNNNYTVYFIGAQDDEIKVFIKNISNMFPKLKISGFHHGYILGDKKLYENVLNEICKNKPDYVFAGMGSPLQEKFLFDLKDKGYKGTSYTCGGFIKQTSIKPIYYPDWVNKFKLRWLYRGIYEPAAILKTLRIPKFILVFLYDYIVYLANYKSHK